MKITRFIIGFFLLFLFVQCSHQDRPEIIWHQRLETLGTFSSIKCTDLNQDGILDIVIGAGKNEFEDSDSGVVALDGKNGEVLWTVPCKDQIVGSAVFLRIDDDDIDDIIIGGRAAQLFAISGKDGSVIWSYDIVSHEYDARGYLRFNFYSAQVLPDQNEDQVQDILITNGGNIAAYNKAGSDRFPGVLAIMSGADGEVIAIDTMPDGKETYMSPVYYVDDSRDKAYILFGSGGETFGGSLFRTSLQNLLANDISGAEVIVTKEGHGFISPPVLADMNQDARVDILCNWHGGEMMAIDGRNLQVLWTAKLDNAELNNQPTPGDVTMDGIPDVFSSFSLGVWPKSLGTVQLIADGKDGSIIYQDTFGCVGFSSALSYDLNDDGSAEFIWNSNAHNCHGIYLGQTTYQLHVLDFKNQNQYEWYPEVKAKNIASTPWIGDLDGDEILDLVFCLQSNSNDIFSYYDIHIFRMSTGIPVNQNPSWTEYMAEY